MRGRHEALLVTLLGLAACSETGGPTASGGSVRDSASVRIVTNAAPDRPRDVDEVLRIGVVDGAEEYAFDGIRDVALAPDGSIWVSDSHPSLRRYSMDGVYLNSAGGAGEGPGESPRGYGDVWVSGSSVLTYSYTPDLQLFDRDGTLVATRRFDQGAAAAVPLGAADGGWYFRRTVFPTGQASRARVPWTVLTGGISDLELDSLLILPGQPVSRRGSHGWGNGSYFDGFPSLTAASGKLYYSHATDYEIRVFDGSGTLTSIVRRSVPPVEFGPDMLADVQTEIEIGWRETLGATVDEASLRSMLQAIEPRDGPDRLPHLDLVLAAPDGTMWVRRADTHPRPAALAVATAMGYIRSAWLPRWKADSTFDVFGPGGEYLATTRFPAEFVPTDATSDRLYGMITDQLDVHYVVAFELGAGG